MHLARHNERTNNLQERRAIAAKACRVLARMLDEAEGPMPPMLRVIDVVVEELGGIKADMAAILAAQEGAS